MNWRWGKFDRENSSLTIQAALQKLQEVQSGLREIKQGELDGFRSRKDASSALIDVEATLASAVAALTG